MTTSALRTATPPRTTTSSLSRTGNESDDKLKLLADRLAAQRAARYAEVVKKFASQAHPDRVRWGTPKVRKPSQNTVSPTRDPKDQPPNVEPDSRLARPSAGMAPTSTDTESGDDLDTLAELPAARPSEGITNHAAQACPSPVQPARVLSPQSERLLQPPNAEAGLEQSSDTGILAAARKHWAKAEPASAADAYSLLITRHRLLEEVIADLEQIAAQAQDTVKWLQLLGDAYVRAGRLELALGAYRLALRQIADLWRGRRYALRFSQP